MKRPDALLLDAGNTVVFIAHDVMAEMLCASGLQVDAQALRRTQREATQRYTSTLHGGGGQQDGWHQMMRAWMLLVGVPEARADEAVASLRSQHEEFNLWRRLPDELPAALARVRDAGIKVAIVSNSEGRLERLFERVGLAHAFDLIVDSALEGVSKPDPELFWRASRRLGVAPQRCLYAGDLPDVDVLGAHRAGMEAVLIDPSNEYPDFREAPRFPSVAALVEVLLDG